MAKDQGTGGRDQGRLLEYLRGRRWFGDKGAALKGARIVDTIPVQWDGSEERFLIARVRVDADAPAFYQLFLREGDTTFADALEADAFRRGIVDAFAGGCTLTQGHARWVIESESDAPFKVPADAPIVLSRAEQSNSSVVIGSQAILKLFRRLAPGVHPDLEVTRFLTVERRFLHTPALLGSIHFVDGEGAWAAGMLQELVPGAADAWTHALDSARAWLASGEGDPSFVAEAERLGAITREMHAVLASGDPGSPFASSDASGTDVNGWTESTVATMRRALRTAKRDAEADGYERGIREIAAGIGTDAGAKIRVHGDYHLGQVLRSLTGAFLVVDFEGEPSRPIEARRAPHSPFKDVAGMLRSFAYAAAVAQKGVGSGLSATGERTDGRARVWESAVRESFLRGYFSESREQRAESGEPKAIVPRSRAHADALIALFEMEKAFYELQYELDHRPEWTWIPEHAIARISAAGSPTSHVSRPE